MRNIRNYELDQKELEGVYDDLCSLRQQVIEDGLHLFDSWKSQVKRQMYLPSAWNLAVYLALRSIDLRPFQRRLLRYGLSSLGRSEARAMANLDAITASLGRLCGRPQEELLSYPAPHRFFFGDRMLAHNTRLVMGTHRAPHYSHIMVTMPIEAAYNYQLVYELVEAGMDSARINCAHDDTEVWQRMIDNIRHAEEESGKPCKIIMDLGGPKVRIAAVIAKKEAPRVHIGQQVRLSFEEPAEFARSAFLSAGEDAELGQQEVSSLQEKKKGKAAAKSKDDAKHKEDTKNKEELKKKEAKAHAISDGEDLGQVSILCSIPEAFTHLEAGDPVLINDGKIRAKVIAVGDRAATLEITHAKPNGSKLRIEKSLNFPGTRLDITPLTAKDLLDLDFVMAHADGISYSFVKNAGDIRLLQEEIAKREHVRNKSISIIAKIETKESVDNLPSIIVQAAGKYPFGVMIARGDLAVEIGYHRLSEIQEEILWICEAAHIPTIWATQVLENLVKTGVPSRAEITDAAMSERAECVMLNKGPYIVEGVRTLVDIRSRMEMHQHKKAPQLRALGIAKTTLRKAEQNA